MISEKEEGGESRDHLACLFDEEELNVVVDDVSEPFSRPVGKCEYSDFCRSTVLLCFLFQVYGSG